MLLNHRMLLPYLEIKPRRRDLKIGSAATVIDEIEITRGLAVHKEETQTKLLFGQLPQRPRLLLSLRQCVVQQNVYGAERQKERDGTYTR